LTAKTVCPYGAWGSPVTSELIVAKTIGLREVTLAGEAVYWLEMRPEENGRCVVVRRGPDGALTDQNPAPFNARTRVHEYGGGAYLVRPDSPEVYFSNFSDQRLYRVRAGGIPEAITPEGELRYADAVLDRGRERLICVREDHTEAGGEPQNTLVAVSLAPGTGAGVRVLASGADFYSSPRLSPDGRHLTWISWDHPNMPWDGTDLWLAPVLADGGLGQAERIAGGPAESIFQPEWSPSGTLYFVSDRSGFWNLYRRRDGQVKAVCPAQAEFGVPQWVFRKSTYAFASEPRIVCTFTREGISHLAILDTETGALEVIETPYTHIEAIQSDGHRAVFLASSPTDFAAIVALDLESRERIVLRRSSTLSLEPDFISTGEPIEFPTASGNTAHGFFYAPQSGECIGPPEERPPLMVVSHGGPTGQADNGLRVGIQFFTTRGFAVLDVNYGGSSGFGRAYRQRLDGQWGVVDVDDCVYGARYLADRGWVDGERLAIRGGSAGGFTTLAALTFRDVFKAGASHFGVSDLEALAQHTHKFESRYLERLIGPYPERADLYRARSPIHAVLRLACPVIFFQGLEDRVVPPEQAEKMVEALRQKKLPVAYLAFPGEQHGFRQAETIKRVLDAELYFYSRVFGFKPADPLEPVPIDNLAP
jgi:dipeptidyl aminopeptidase/acylaminoacyl peptidase